MATAIVMAESLEANGKATAPAHLSEREAEVIALFVQLSRALVHPCKIYNLLNIGAPVLYIRPQSNHVTDIFEDGHSTPNGSPHPQTPLPAYARAAHGDVETVLKAIARIRGGASRGRPSLPGGACAQFSVQQLLPKLIAALESE